MHYSLCYKVLIIYTTFTIRYGYSRHKRQYKTCSWWGLQISPSFESLRTHSHLHWNLSLYFRYTTYLVIYNCDVLDGVCTQSYIVHITTVPVGGSIFEAYLWMFSGHINHRLWKCALMKVTVEEPAISMDTNELLVEREQTKFCGYLLYHMGMVTKKTSNQGFYLNFAAKYYGLSRRGNLILHKYGYLVSVTATTEYIRDQALLAKKKTM